MKCGSSIRFHLITFLVILQSYVATETSAAETSSAGKPYQSTYEAVSAGSILITGATVLDGAGRRLDLTDVMLKDGKIDKVGLSLPSTNEATVIDASNRWVTPGIVDVHSHNGTYTLPLTEQSLADISELSSPNVANTWIEHAIDVQDPAFQLALASGVTTIQILPGSTPIFGGRSVVVKPVPANTVFDMKFPDAPQGLKMACGENPKGYFGAKDVAPTSRQGAVAIIREAWLKAQAYREKLQNRGDGETEAPERDLTLETLVGALEGSIRVHLHCYRADDIAVMLEVAREFGYQIAAIHHAAEAYKIPHLLKNAGVCAAVWSDWWGFKMEVRDAIKENAAFVDAAGACVLMHSDSPFVAQHLNLEAAKAMAAGRRAGLNIEAEKAVRWITHNPARALGLDDRIGRIEPGYNADVVIWSGNPFSVYSKVDQVFIDGALHFDRTNCLQQQQTDIAIGSADLESCK